jgi:hypothetical protein
MLLEGRGPYQGLLVLHPLNERSIYANIKKLGKQNLVGSVSDHSINDAYCILCKTLLVLPNSNADSERAFSIIKMIHTELKISTRELKLYCKRPNYC